MEIISGKDKVKILKNQQKGKSIFLLIEYDGFKETFLTKNHQVTRDLSLAVIQIKISESHAISRLGFYKD